MSHDDIKAALEAASPWPWSVGRNRYGHAVSIDGKDGFSEPRSTTCGRSASLTGGAS